MTAAQPAHRSGAGPALRRALSVAVVGHLRKDRVTQLLTGTAQVNTGRGGTCHGGTDTKLGAVPSVGRGAEHSVSVLKLWSVLRR